MNKILQDVRKELKQNIDVEYKKGAINYFKEKIKIYGVRIPIARKISAKYFKEVKGFKKNKIFSICETLLKTGYGEESTIAFDWVLFFDQ